VKKRKVHIRKIACVGIFIIGISFYSGTDEQNSVRLLTKAYAMDVTTNTTTNTTVNDATNSISNASWTITSGGNVSGAISINSGGTFTVSGGTISGAISMLDSTSRLTLTSNQAIGSLSGSGTVDLGSSTLSVGDNTFTTFSGTISGTNGNLIKTGSGQLALSGTNSYTGTTTVSGGSLVIYSAANLGTGALILGNGTKLGMAYGLGTTINNKITLTGGDAFFINNASIVTLSGTIEGPGNLWKEGSGTLTLTGASTSHTGNISVLEGTLAISSADNLGSGDLLIRNNACVDVSAAASIPNKIGIGAGVNSATLNNRADVTLSGVISGSGI